MKNKRLVLARPPGTQKVRVPTVWVEKSTIERLAVFCVNRGDASRIINEALLEKVEKLEQEAEGTNGKKSK